MKTYPTTMLQTEEAYILHIKPDNQKSRIFVNILTPIVVIAIRFLMNYVRQNLWISFSVFNILLNILVLYIIFMLLRNVLWMNKGKETVIIEPNQITYFLNFYLWKERKYKKKYQHIETLFRRKTSKKTKDDQLLIDEEFVPNDAVVLGFKLDNKDVLAMYLPISLSDAQTFSKFS